MVRRGKERKEKEKIQSRQKQHQLNQYECMTIQILKHEKLTKTLKHVYSKL
jgi:hypothetical protein